MRGTALIINGTADHVHMLIRFSTKFPSAPRSWPLSPGRYNQPVCPPRTPPSPPKPPMSPSSDSKCTSSF
jgi:hypothetical protein